MSRRHLYIVCLPMIVMYRLFQRLSRIARTMFELSRVQDCGSGFSCGEGLSIQNHGYISIGAAGEFARNVQLSTYRGGNIEIGHRCFVGDGTKIISAEGAIRVGNDCLIAEYVTIRASNHGINLGQPINTQASVVDSIEIGDDVWIGRGAMICAGAKVRSGCVIGANAVVTRTLVTEENCVYVGVPARFTKRRY
jgi:acetyltransferase-like isoleucine patch superfamily enzyme